LKHKIVINFDFNKFYFTYNLVSEFIVFSFDIKIIIFHQIVYVIYIFQNLHPGDLKLAVEAVSADSEKEENMVEWLRDVGMPAEYVNKLARMFQDIKVSEDLNQQFKNANRLSHDHLADSINIKILNAGAWARGSERVKVSLPLEMEDLIPEVEEFYRKKHNGRKLQWFHHMSNGTVRTLF
jgi:cullin-5